MEALINRIITSSFVDGPGSRTAVFVQGCNMKCVYCHNPETQTICRHCGQCAARCPAGALTMIDGKVLFDSKKCAGCDRCIKECPYDSSPKARLYSSLELFDLIRKNRDFIDGVTISGGECSIQTGFIEEFGELLHSGTSLTLFADSNAYAEPDEFKKLVAAVDGLMLDLKAFDKNRHVAITGVDNTKILQNIKLAAASGKLHEIRLVLLEDLNDGKDELDRYFEFIKGLDGQPRLKLIPFSPLGVRGELAGSSGYPDSKYNDVLQQAERVLKDRIIKVCYNKQGKNYGRTEEL